MIPILILMNPFQLCLNLFFRNQQVKKRWVIETGRKKGGDILAVQTLRNWILASTFLATGKLHQKPESYLFSLYYDLFWIVIIYRSSG